MKSWITLALLGLAAPALAAADSPLAQLAKEGGQTPAALALIEQGVDVNVPAEDGSSALLWAVHRDDRVLVERLLKARADPDSANGDGQTALMVVAHTSNVRAADLLLAHGAHVDATEKLRGQTALHFAAAESQAEMVQELLRHRADPNASTRIDHDLRQVSAEP